MSALVPIHGDRITPRFAYRCQIFGQIFGVNSPDAVCDVLASFASRQAIVLFEEKQNGAPVIVAYAHGWAYMTGDENL